MNGYRGTEAGQQVFLSAQEGRQSGAFSRGYGVKEGENSLCMVMFDGSASRLVGCAEHCETMQLGAGLDPLARWFGEWGGEGPSSLPLREPTRGVRSLQTRWLAAGPRTLIRVCCTSPGSSSWRSSLTAARPPRSPNASTTEQTEWINPGCYSPSLPGRSQNVLSSAVLCERDLGTQVRGYNLKTVVIAGSDFV